MPVTFHPSDKKLEKVNDYHTKNAAINATEMLEKACNRQIAENCKEIFQSSFGNLNKDVSPIVGAHNGFVKAATEAYNQHHHLVIRPDDVWITVLSQFNLYVNANAEALRKHFVDFEGKRQLTVTAGGNRYTVDFGALAGQMGKEIQKNVIDPELRKWIIPGFTTTTDNDVIVSSVIMMATLKKYFEYRMCLMCGLPAVTLLGEKSDWVEMSERAKKLPSFGKETGDWYKLLQPVLDMFVKAFDTPDSKENKDFWQKIVNHSGGGSGPTYLDGWITAFTFFDEDGKPVQERGQLNLGGVTFPLIDTKNVPPAYAEVPVKLDDNGQQISTTMVAGLVGWSAESSGKPSGAENHTGKHDTIQPVAGWWIFETKQ